MMRLENKLIMICFMCIIFLLFFIKNVVSFVMILIWELMRKLKNSMIRNLIYVEGVVGSLIGNSRIVMSMFGIISSRNWKMFLLRFCIIFIIM